MGEVKTYACDQCGRLKYEAEAWFAVKLENDHKRFMIDAFGGGLGDIPVAEYDWVACSRRCLGAYIERFVQKVMDKWDKFARQTTTTTTSY